MWEHHYHDQFTIVITGAPSKLNLLEKIFDGLWDKMEHTKIRNRPPANWHRQDRKTLIWKNNLTIYIDEPYSKIRNLDWIRDLSQAPDFQNVQFHIAIEMVFNPTASFRRKAEYRKPCFLAPEIPID